MREGLELMEGIRRLGRMSAVKSVHRNLIAEDAAVKRNIEASERMLFDQDISSAFDASGKMPDDMDWMAARDITINLAPKQQSPQQTAQPGAANPSPGGGLSKLAIAAALSAALGSGGIGALVANYFGKPSTTIVQPVGDPNIYGFDGESVPKRQAGK